MSAKENAADFVKRQMTTIKSENEKLIQNSKDFPNCKGLYPDCPDEPSLYSSMCRTCPKTEELKKPKIEDN